MTKREELATKIVEHNEQLPGLIRADRSARDAVEVCKQLLADAEAALIVAHQTQADAQAIMARVVASYTNDINRGTILGLHNWAERVRSVLAARPEREDGLAAFLARIEGLLLDALDGPVTVDHTVLAREYDQAITPVQEAVT